MHFLMTTDVESFSIPLNRYDAETAKEVYNVGFRTCSTYMQGDEVKDI